MDKALRVIIAAFFYLTGLVALWFLLSNLQPIGPAPYLLALLLLLAFAMAVKLLWSQAARRGRASFHRLLVTKPLWVCLVASLLAVLVRLLIFRQFSYVPTSDPGTFVAFAEAVANDATLPDNYYLAAFPYLATYINLLGGAIRLIGSSWLATIVVNTAFDLLGAIIVFHLVKRVGRAESPAPSLAFLLWVFSPFNLLFSLVSLPIVIVNCFIVGGVYLTELLRQKLAQAQRLPAVLLGLALGLTLGFANWFRPIFAVFLIALSLYFLFILLIKRAKKLTVLMTTLSFILVIGVFWGLQTINGWLVARQTSYAVPKTGEGWSVFVGANAEYHGSWNAPDQTWRQALDQELGYDTEAVQQRLLQEGIERYKNLGLLGALRLMVEKQYHFANKQNDLYNIEGSVVGYSGSRLMKLMNVYIILFTLALFAVVLCYNFRLARTAISKSKLSPTLVLLLALLLLGLFFSNMLVESAFRYAQVLYPILIIFTVLYFDQHPEWSQYPVKRFRRTNQKSITHKKSPPNL